MDNYHVQLVGGPVGQHGTCTFYKSFKYNKNGIKRLVNLCDFFFVKPWTDSDLLCIGELHLLWTDKNSELMLANLHLYFLPDNTPWGRNEKCGEFEVLGLNPEKVVLRVEDLVTWIMEEVEFTWESLCRPDPSSADPVKKEKEETSIPVAKSLIEISLEEAAEKEKKSIESEEYKNQHTVVVLSYQSYCRYRAMCKRLEGVENEFLRFKLLSSLGGFPLMCKNTKVLYCRSAFSYPEMEEHELLCNHLAPKLKGRPRGKRKKRSVSPCSESNESEASVANAYNAEMKRITTGRGRNGLRCNTTTSPRRSTRSIENTERKDFLKNLTAFMIVNQTPIGRIPSVGSKELNLHDFYTKVQKLGGYEAVSENRLWKCIFDELGGYQSSTNGATTIRRHYEKFLRDFERHTLGDKGKSGDRKILKCKANSSKTLEPTPGPSGLSRQSKSSTSTDTSISNKNQVQVKPEVKTTTSLRSVRVKTERQKDKQVTSNKTVSVSNINNNNNVDMLGVSEVAEMKPRVKIIDIDSDTQIDISEPVVVRKLQSSNQRKSTDEKPIKMEEESAVSKHSESVSVIDVPVQVKCEEEDTKYKNMNLLLHEVKKRKLDILKEGGLEVTPVRPTVIQQSAIVNKPNNHNDVPQPSSPEDSKRVSLTFPQAINITEVKTSNNNNVMKLPASSSSYTNRSTPPKVVQSKSIYSYSEKTIYGNPKDILQKDIIVAPRFPPRHPRQPGGDLLDLSLTSPQKPVVEIMRVPQIANSTKKTPFQFTPPPNLEGTRIGSNLEITLVTPSPPSKTDLTTTNSYKYHQATRRLSMSAPYVSSRGPSKMTDGTRYKNSHRREANNKSGLDMNFYNSGNATALVPPPHLKNEPDQLGQNYPNHLFQPFTPPMSFSPHAAVYYSAAMQNLYSNIAPSQQPFLTPEQFKLYTDLMANPRMPFSYQKIQDNGSSIGSSKKP